MRSKHNQRGSMTLETAIVLPFFIFMFLFVFGFFGLIGARNQVSHAMMQSAKSLSLDPFLLERTDLVAEDKSRVWGGFSDMVIELIRLDNDPYFMGLTDWYSTEKMGDDNKLDDGSFDMGAESYVFRNRFIGYFSGGDEDLAQKKLDDLGVVGGLDGMDFQMAINGDVMIVTVKYELEYLFDFQGLLSMPVEQTVQVRLWK